MNIHEYRSLLSEQGALKTLIDESPETNVIGRMSLEHRLSKVESELERYKGHSPRLISVSLTFRGKPVSGSHGIRADFGSAAVKAFANAVTLVGASQRSWLPATGRVPHGGDYQLMITGTALGSFGFQVEDASEQLPLVGEVTPVEQAIKRIKGILEASTGSDEQLEHAIGDTDKRAVRSVGAFVQRVAVSAAVCALEFNGDVFRFRDPSQVRESADRLNQFNIEEVDLTFAGCFQGYLPRARSAEFQIEKMFGDIESEIMNPVITGKVDPSVANTVDISEIIGEPVRINVRRRQVGAGRHHYTITRCIP